MLYTYHLFQNRQQTAAKTIEQRWAGTIASDVSSNCNFNDESIRSSLSDGSVQSLIIPIQPIVILLIENSIERPMFIVSNSWNL